MQGMCARQVLQRGNLISMGISKVYGKFFSAVNSFFVGWVEERNPTVFFRLWTNA